ncbi:unnamed protein product [Sphagnum balticum]
MQDDLRISCSILICQLASLIFDQLLTMGVVRVELMAPSHMAAAVILGGARITAASSFAAGGASSTARSCDGKSVELRA